MCVCVSVQAHITLRKVFLLADTRRQVVHHTAWYSGSLQENKTTSD